MIFSLLGMLAGAASTALTVKSQLDQAKAATQAAEYNNTLAQREAENTERETAEGIKRERIRQRESLATMRAKLGSGGVRSDTGAPAILTGETAARFQTSVADAARAAAMQADSLRAKGKMALWEGQQTAKAAKLSALGTAISGVGNLASSFGHNRFTGAL